MKTRPYRGADRERCFSVALTEDGGFCLTGFSEYPETGTKAALLVKVIDQD